MRRFPRLIQSGLRRLIQVLPERLQWQAAANVEYWQGCVDAEILHLPSKLPRDKRRTALDIGANRGVMTYFLARQFEAVHAFEPNPLLARDLESRVTANVRVWPVAVSDRLGVNQLRVPVSRGVWLDGWGSLEKLPPFDDLDRIDSFSIDLVTVDSLHLENVDFIKIDVERHEIEVLRGAMETISRCKPWFSIEVWEPFRKDVTALMDAQGYKAVALLEVTGVPGTPANMVFVPADCCFDPRSASLA